MAACYHEKPKIMKSMALKRAYDPAGPEDGLRILVDRLWPRGLKRESAAIDHWLREVAPSNALRQWFGHDPARWPEFQRRYKAELQGNKKAVAELRALLRGRGQATLLFAAKDTEHNNAVALMRFLER